MRLQFATNLVPKHPRIVGTSVEEIAKRYFNRSKKLLLAGFPIQHAALGAAKSL